MPLTNIWTCRCHGDLKINLVDNALVVSSWDEDITCLAGPGTCLNKLHFSTRILGRGFSCAPASLYCYSVITQAVTIPSRFRSLFQYRFTVILDSHVGHVLVDRLK